jgi:hypothetical protein
MQEREPEYQNLGQLLRSDDSLRSIDDSRVADVAEDPANVFSNRAQIGALTTPQYKDNKGGLIYAWRIWIYLTIPVLKPYFFYTF